jgi:uncharacterized protein
MRLAIFGGTGRVGRRLIEYATAAGHSVHALVRDPARLPANALVDAEAGDVTDPAAVSTVVRGSDAVLSVLGGAGLANPGTAISSGMRNIVQAMERAGVRRVLAVGGSGVLDDPRGGLRSEAPGFPEVFAAINREHLGTWEALRSSSLDWTMVCCPDLLDGERTLHYRVLANLLPPDGKSISVEDVAAFMLDQLNGSPFHRQRVGIAY